MATYTLQYYQEIIRKPMQMFKKNILSQVTKRQTQDRIMKLIDEEEAEKAKELEEEMAIDYYEDQSDEDLMAKRETENILDENIDAINRRADRYYEDIQQF